VDANGTVFAAWGGHFINTEDIRRDKSVVSCVYEVIVGTRDSERKSAWRQQNLSPEYDANDFADPQGYNSAITNQMRQQHRANNGHFVDHGLEVESTDLERQSHQHRQYHSQHSLPSVNNEPPPAISRFPLPDFAEDDQNLSEKEKLRRAEARLLPSRPPEDGVESSATAGAHAPSAPGNAGFNSVDAGPSAPPSTGFSPTPHLDATVSAPAYHHHAPPPSLPPTDDKHELHRRRLEAERSSPEGSADVVEGSSATESAPRGQELAPSAPVLNEDDEFGFDFNIPSSSHHQSLPRYER
jgi:hypothetical protein